jgi:hypothetical protein
MNYSFLEAARDELEEAVSHDEGQRPGLGEEFAREVELTIQKMLSWPAA